MQRLWFYGLVSWLSLSYGDVCAQAVRSPRRVTAEGHLDYDTFFGFYPSVYARLSLDSLHEVAAYGVFYTNPAFFGAETGVTISLTTPRKHWTIAPGLGLVSGSVFVQGRSFAIGEGGFGSLSVQFEQAGWYGQGSGAYWGVFRRKTADTYDFAYYFVQAGRIISPKFRVGLVFGQLGDVRRPRNEGDETKFNVHRFGISATLALPFRLNVQAGGGLATGTGPRTFLQFGLSRFLSRP